MAIEIKELIIRAVVDYERVQENPNQQPFVADVDRDKEAIIQACVKQVLKIINRTNKR